MPNKKNADNAKNIICNECSFVTSKESNYNKHLLTRKHKFLTNPNIKNAINEQKIYDCKCGKMYKHSSTLSLHKKTCQILHQNNTNIVIENKMIELLIKENTDFKTIMVDMVKNMQTQIIEICKNNSVTNNINNNHSNNKTFNLQVFLNETCKDAMNMSDFIKSFDLQLSDLETVGELGYIDGTTKIFLEKLRSMDIYKRPIHCSDAKREIIYVKDDNVWTKEENDYPKLRKAIKVVSFNNMKLVYNWSMANPDSLDNETKLNDTYVKLVFETSGGKGLIVDSENKIIRRIVKEIIIDK